MNDMRDMKDSVLGTFRTKVAEPVVFDATKSVVDMHKPSRDCRYKYSYRPVNVADEGWAIRLVVLL